MEKKNPEENLNKNLTENPGESQEESLEEKLKENLEKNLRESLAGSMSENLEPDFEENLKENLERNLRESLEENSEDGREETPEVKREENRTGKRKGGREESGKESQGKGRQAGRSRNMKKGKKSRRKQKWFDVITTAIIIISLGIFLFSGYRLYSIWSEYRKGTTQYDHLAAYFPTLPETVSEPTEGRKDPVSSGETASESNAPSEPEETAAPEDPRDWKAFYQEMKAMNPDYIGWIVLEDTPINYPIVQAEDNDYYLHRLFDGTENFSGSLFADFRVENCFGKGNTIIYGHNMKNGSMFAGLLYYREEWFYQSHKTFSVYAEEGEIVYEVFAIYATDPVSDTYVVGFPSDEEYLNWANAMYAQSVVKPEVNFDAEMSVLTLSTCINNSEDRLIIQARRITPYAE